MDIKTALPDPALETAGVWVDYRDGARVLIARLPNPRFNKRRNALMKPYRDMEARGTLPDDVLTDVLAKAMAETVVLGWDGFTADGAPFPYSTDACYRLLKDSLSFRNDMATLASAEENFRREAVESAEKNSSTSSAGSASSATG